MKRFSQKLKEWSFTSVYRPGKDNANADALSRSQVDLEELKVTINAIKANLKLSVITTQSILKCLPDFSACYLARAGAQHHVPTLLPLQE